MLKKKIRSKYLVKHGLQLGLALRFLIVFVLFSLFMLFEAAAIFWPVLTIHVPSRLLEASVNVALIRLAYFSVPIALVIVALVVVLTHRIAGPLFRIQKTLKEILETGKASPIHLRKHDELQEFTGLINRFTGLLERDGSLETSEEKRSKHSR